jgi:hypothetical protein
LIDSPKLTFCQTESHGNSEVSSKIRLRSGDGVSTRSPNDQISPPLVASNPDIRYSSVDLPQPDGPSSATNSLGATSNSILRNASCARGVPSAHVLPTARQIIASFDENGCTDLLATNVEPWFTPLHRKTRKQGSPQRRGEG